MIYDQRKKAFNKKDAMNASGGGNMEDKQKKWITPRLIVLGRGTPEENVLAGCKTKAGRHECLEDRLLETIG